MAGYNRGDDPSRVNARIVFEDDDPGINFRNDNDTWMVAYLDLMTLLLALFIIMGALSHSKAGVNLQSNSEMLKKSETPGKPESVDASVKRQGQKKGMDNELQRIIGSNSLGGVMDIKVQPGVIRLQMDAKFLFDTGQAKLKKGSEKLLQEIVQLFGSKAKQIAVEGHSDNTPIKNHQFQSNWSLSSARAVSVVESLIQLGIPANKLHATAYGDTRPVMSNVTKEGRAKNRRVMFVIELGPEYLRSR